MPAEPRAGRWSLPGALRHRDFALLWSGQSISLTGDGIYSIALALETLRIDDRPSALSYVVAARLVPTVLLLLLGGVVVDRIPRRLAMLASDSARALVVAAMALLTALGAINLLDLVLLSLVFGAADALFYPASTAIVPELLPEELLVQGSALSSVSMTATQSLLGPAIGGVLVTTIGNAWGFGADALSFVVSAGCLLLMAHRPRPAPAPGSRRMLSEVRQGFSYCLSHPWLWAVLLSAGVANFAAYSPLFVLETLLVRHVLHQSGVALGLVLACGGAGGGAAALWVGRFGAPRRRITWMLLGWGLAGVADLALALATSIWWAGAAVFVLDGLLLYGNALWAPMVQTLVPREILGRVSSVDWLVSLSLSPLGVLAAGAAAGAIGVRQTMAIGASIAIFMSTALFVPGIRDPERDGSLPSGRASRRAGERVP